MYRVVRRCRCGWVSRVHALRAKNMECLAGDTALFLSSHVHVVSVLFNLLSRLTHHISRSCPFRVNASWKDGSMVRDSIITTSSTLEGTTGTLNMSLGDVADGREVDGVTFCAVNLRPHPSLGGRFEVIRMMNGSSLGEEDGEGFQVSWCCTRDRFWAWMLELQNAHPLSRERTR